VVFLISAYSTDAESKAGYFVVRTKMIDSNGSAVSTIKADIEINIPSGAKEGIPSWSIDGRSWYKLQRIESEVLPPDVHAGYFVERDGRIAIFTDYLMLFGFRKLQTPLKISAPALSIETNSGVQLTYKGGSGEGQIKFFTRTNEFCTVTSGGVVTGVKTGKCIVAANKEASGIYAQAASSAISIFMQESSVQPSNSSKDPNHLLLCQELSYTLQTNSTLVYVNLCEEDKGELATLEVGTKSTSGSVIYTVVGRQLLDGNGVSLFKLAKALKVGQVLRVKAEGKVQITTVIGSK
jgi:hypothetical protein